MMRWLQSGWRVPAYERFEIFWMRIGLVIIAYISLVPSKSISLHTSQPHPQGIANFVPLHWLSNPSYFLIAKILLIMSGLIFIFGIKPKLCLPIITLVHTLIHTLHNSQGSTHHHAQIVTLVLLAQTLTYWWPDLVRLFTKKIWQWPYKRNIHQWAVYFSLQAIAGTYLLAALSKLIKSKGLWIFQSHHIVVEMQKTHWQNYYGKLEFTTKPEQLERMNFLLENPNFARLLMGSGLILEILAIFLLWNRLSALVIGAFLIALHLGIAFLMKLHFPHNEQLLFLFAINLPFWIMFLSKRNKSVNSLH